MINVNFKCSTDGTGLWTNVSKTVRCIILEVFNDELRVYFKNWNVPRNGLIYTDPLFLAELRANLNDIGFSPEVVDEIYYSEQGMQGPDYVSFDVSTEFFSEFIKISN